jgi:hypothetical protein
MRFILSCFCFVIKPAEKLVLPEYKGAVLRGGLGWTFKDLVCIRKDRDCPDCLISRRCSYFRIFETPVPTDTQMMRKYPFAPHPFVITPPLDAKMEFDNSCELNFDLTLIGHAIDYLPYFVYVFDELGRRGLGKAENQFALARIEDVSGVDGARLIYDGANKRFSDNFHPLDLDKFQEIFPAIDVAGDSPKVALKLLTPTHIVHDSGIDHDLKFTSVMESLLRRIRLLQHFHCLDRSGSASAATLPPTQESVERNGGDELTLEEIHRLLSISDRVETIEKRIRWTGNQRKSGHNGIPMTLGGFTGEMTYRFPSQEALSALTPFLRLGEFIHIGKHTSFGFGKMKIDEIAAAK